LTTDFDNLQLNFQFTRGATTHNNNNNNNNNNNDDDDDDDDNNNNMHPNTYIQMQKVVILGTCSIVRNFLNHT
jgi:hypothetical protein